MIGQEARQPRQCKKIAVAVTVTTVKPFLVATIKIIIIIIIIINKNFRQPLIHLFFSLIFCLYRSLENSFIYNIY